MEDIIKLLANNLGYTYTQITGKERRFDMTVARQVIWARLHELHLSQQEISVLFGRRPSSVGHGIKNIYDLVSIGDYYVRRQYERAGEVLMS